MSTCLNSFAPARSASGQGELLWISDLPVPPNIQQAVQGRHTLRELSLSESLLKHAEKAKLVLIYSSQPSVHLRQLAGLMDELESSNLVAVLLLQERDWSFQRVIGRHGRFCVAPAEASPAILSAQIEAALQLQPALESLQKEVARIRALGTDIGKTLDTIDEEMRLAARLQRDFLPHKFPHVGPLEFSVMFRPAAWVSGDIYSVERLDELHVGLYVADAVGHGLPAALLTMFIKQALPTKRVDETGYHLVSPEQAMLELNRAICEQDLSSCQFCSALYCVINSRTLEMTYARGGHPEGLLLHADGHLSTLDAPGGLLGIFPEEKYELRKIQLQPGDRLVLHSDGAEDVFRHEGGGGREGFIQTMQRLRHLPVDRCAFQLAAVIDSMRGSLHPEDDITVVTMQVG
jgi:sigma-B regulation protein RsbU (phosphoserine phosphatase)